MGYKNLFLYDYSISYISGLLNRNVEVFQKIHRLSEMNYSYLIDVNSWYITWHSASSQSISMKMHFGRNKSMRYVKTPQGYLWCFVEPYLFPYKLYNQMYTIISCRPADRGRGVALPTVNPGVVSSIPRRTKSFGGDFKRRSRVSVLYTGHVKEPEGSFEKE